MTVHFAVGSGWISPAKGTETFSTRLPGCLPRSTVGFTGRNTTPLPLLRVSICRGRPWRFVNWTCTTPSALCPR